MFGFVPVTELRHEIIEEGQRQWHLGAGDRLPSAIHHHPPHDMG
jgi:hypothetical protein